MRSGEETIANRQAALRRDVRDQVYRIFVTRTKSEPLLSSVTRATPVAVLILCATPVAHSQTGELHGQASAWLTASHSVTSEFQPGIRYIPDILLKNELSDGLDASMELSLNAYGTVQYNRDLPSAYEWNVKPYRAWLRLSTERFETRIGLQKINFGSASLLRPLMWFDRIDPRDPLQLTDGVYGVLARYYFPNNANIWLWGLYGNDQTKGWELSPTERNTVEYGGRAQSPLWTGELALSYHHRRADLSPQITPPAGAGGLIAPEDRLGLDGKWNVGIGVWFEAVMIRQDNGILPMKYQRQGTIGADYTIAAGNGLYVATEYFRADNPATPFGDAGGAGFSALSLTYPLGVVDQISAILYRDWTNRQWYRLITWQRTFDNWSFYLLGFWNPDNMQIFRTQAGANSFGGAGIQLMAIFNH